MKLPCVSLIFNIAINYQHYLIFFYKLVLDYLLSNNHVNCIIVHKFDFSDEEVMAYYISFLKTMSLKLNVHTIHFFFNEVTIELMSFSMWSYTKYFLS